MFSLHQLHIYPPNFRLRRAIAFFLCPFYLKSWWSSRFPSSSYLIHQIFACRISFFPLFAFLHKKLVLRSYIIFDWLFTHMEICFLLTKYARPPWSPKDCRPPLGTHLLTTIDPLWPKARVGSGICRLMQPLPGAEGHANLWLSEVLTNATSRHEYSRRLSRFLSAPKILVP